MVREEMDWLRSNKCRYCGSELQHKTGTERIICRVCGKVNYKNKKIKFENELKRKILHERHNINEKQIKK